MLAEDDRKTLEHGAVPIPEEIAKHAHVGAAKYREMYAASVADPEAFWAEQGKRLDWMTPYSRAKNTSFAWPDVSIRWFEDGTSTRRPTASTATSPSGATQTAILWEPDDPAEAGPAHQLPRASRRGRPHGQRAQGPRRRQGRPGGHLPADDPRGGLRHAGLRPHRRDPFDRLRRLLAGCAGQPNQRLRRAGGDHRRRGAARRQGHGAQDQRQQGAAALPARREMSRRPAHRRRGRLGSRPRPLAARAGGGRPCRLRARADGSRGPAVHPLHLGLHRQAEGRGAHHRRLSPVRRDDP